MYFYQGLLNNKGISKVSCPFFSGFCIVKWKSVIAGSIRIILEFKGGSTAGAVKKHFGTGILFPDGNKSPVYKGNTMNTAMQAMPVLFISGKGIVFFRQGKRSSGDSSGTGTKSSACIQRIFGIVGVRGK